MSGQVIHHFNGVFGISVIVMTATDSIPLFPGVSGPPITYARVDVARSALGSPCTLHKYPSGACFMSANAIRVFKPHTRP